MENKENIWKSNDSWKIEHIQGKGVSIQQISNQKTESDSNNPFEQKGGKVKMITKFLKNPYGDGTEVPLQEIVHVEEKKYWISDIGKSDTDEYFTIETPRGGKILTAISEGSLEIKGNNTMLAINQFVHSVRRQSVFFNLAQRT